MWSRLLRNRFLWSMIGAIAVAYVGRAMSTNARDRARGRRQMNGVMDMLSRTGRTVADGTMRLVRR